MATAASGAAAGAAVGGIPGALIGGIGGALIGANTNAKNIKFQKWAMAHAHQYQVNDMRKAGLNPILSATGGSGAKPGGGSSVDAGGAFQRGMSDIEPNKLARATAKKVSQDEKLSKQTTYNESIKGKILDEQLVGAQNEGNIDRTIGGELSRWLKRFGGTAALVGGGAASAVGVKKLMSNAKKGNKKVPVKPYKPKNKVNLGEKRKGFKKERSLNRKLKGN